MKEPMFETCHRLSTSLVLFALFLGFTGNISFAQETFKLNSSSAAYDIVVEIDRCDQEQKAFDLCIGPGRVSIYRKRTASPFQVLSLKNINVHKDQLAYNPEIDKKTRKLYDDEYSFIFGDFNFDSKEDLAICNGRNGGYGAPSYSVYLYDGASNRFVESVSLSKLSEDYLGFFFVDSRKRQLVASSKSGCCYHETDVYKVVLNKPVLVEKIVEEASGDDARGYVVIVTTRKLVKDKWIKRVSKKRIRGEHLSSTESVMKGYWCYLIRKPYQGLIVRTARPDGSRKVILARPSLST